MTRKLWFTRDFRCVAKYGHTETDPEGKILCTTKKQEKWRFSVLNYVFKKRFKVR